MKVTRTYLVLMGILMFGMSLSGCTTPGNLAESASAHNDESSASNPESSGDASKSTDASQDAQEAMLVFSLSSEKEASLLGEPIVLTATLINRGQSSIDVAPLFDPTYGFAYYTITPPGNKPEAFMPVWLDDGVAKLVTLRSGQSASGAAKIFVGNSGPVFKIPGRYVIEGRYGGAVAPPLTLEILAPESEGDEEAAALMLNEEVMFFLFAGGGEHLKQALENLNRLVEAFPDSILSGYANFALGVYYSQDGRDFATNTVRKADPDRAKSFFERSMGYRLPEYFRIQSYTEMIHTFVLMKDADQAAQYLKLFENEFGTSPLAEFHLDLAQREVRGLR